MREGDSWANCAQFSQSSRRLRRWKPRSRPSGRCLSPNGKAGRPARRADCGHLRAGDRIALASFIEAQIAAADEERKTAEAAFSTAASVPGIDFDWRAEKSPDSLVSPHAGSMARAADIIICPQVRTEASIGRHQIEEVVFSSGRPVIGLPAGWMGEDARPARPRRLGRRPRGGAGGVRCAATARPRRRRSGSSPCKGSSTSRCASSPRRRYRRDAVATRRTCGDQHFSEHARQRARRTQGAGARFRRRHRGDGLLRALALPRADPRRRLA